ncbi:hypothetical protein, variant 3 [Exophiala mesophila]|nr:hypothetical protein, variant 1 [Exophiala mesophila]XP_016220657.1 hypothetical protein, variant 2 [Exophiala mesophila]XP_016220658.1 hypothetical protein, variant 3 [Exophiala mesophila]KIV89082.1 hypothetical protein, variant 1 [Exophiala mesophila]KIV89083.1 hypothetical protein, variant 2 [Exophiala mesophila]KIV89084.1 hypothetical protein, variant 3 [Exophiala mesophila]
MSAHQGIEIVWDPVQSDNRVYTLILKDELLPLNPDNGRQRSTVSWEYDFGGSQETATATTTAGGGVGSGPVVCFVPWSGLKPTYRGKPKEDAACLDVSSIKRISIMIRSFFGTQEGRFGLKLLSITACSPLESVADGMIMTRKHDHEPRAPADSSSTDQNARKDNSP